MKKGFCCKGGPFSPGFWLKAWILVILGKEELHGYEIMNKLRNIFPDIFLYKDPSHMGRGYKLLRLLEMEGLIQSKWEVIEGGPAKRIYSLTEEGKKVREQTIKSLEDNFEFLKKFIEFSKDKEV